MRGKYEITGLAKHVETRESNLDTHPTSHFEASYYHNKRFKAPLYCFKVISNANGIRGYLL